jgi:hypothetical protein
MRAAPATPRCPPGYTKLPDNINANTVRLSVALCVKRATRQASRATLLRSVLLSSDGCQTAGNGFVRVASNLNAFSPAAEVAELCVSWGG